MKIKLTEGEHAFTLTGGFLSPELLLQFQTAKTAGSRHKRVIVTLDDEQTHEVREALIDQLQKVGFGEDDEPTPDGLILEGLIDKFRKSEKV